jgi:hypothetical protein
MSWRMRWNKLANALEWAGKPRGGGGERWSSEPISYRPGPPPKLNPDLAASHGHAACLRADTYRQAQAGMLCRQIQYLVEEGDWAQQGEEVEAPSNTEERGT